MKRIFSFLLLAVAAMAQGAPTHKVVLTWPASPSAGITGYNVKRAVGACSATAIFATLTTTTVLTYTDLAVTEGATYCYAVTAVTAKGESPNAGMFQATIPVYTASDIPLPPGAPIGSAQ